MSEVAKEQRIVRCPKCKGLLPEPPECSVYECGGCGTLLRAKRKSCLSDGVSEKSVDGAPLASVSENEREINGAIRGKLKDGNLEKRTSNMISKSPAARSRYGDLVGPGLSDSDMFSKSSGRPTGSIKRSQIRERVGDGLNAVSKSPARLRNGDVNESGLTDSAALGKSQARSINESIRWSPVRDVSDGFLGVRKSPARSIHGYASESHGESVSVNTERTAREKGGSWVDQIGRQEGVEVTQKASFDEPLVLEDMNMHQAEFSGPNLRRSWRDSAEEAALTELVSNLRRVQVSSRSDQIGMLEKSEYAKHRRPLEVPIDVVVHHGLERKRRDLRFQSGDIEGLARLEETVEQSIDEGDGLQVTCGDTKVVDEYRRMSNYPSEVPMNLNSDTFHGHGELRHAFRDSSRSSSAQNLKQELAELLRRYYEIMEQLGRTGGVTTDKMISHTVPDNYIQDEILGSTRGAMHLSSADKNMRPPRANHGHGRIPLMGAHNVEDAYLPMHDDSYLPQIPRMNSNHHLRYYPQESSHVYVPLQPIDFHQDRCHPHDKCFHHPTCLCSYCYINNSQARPQTLSAAFDNIRAPSGVYDPIFSVPNGYCPQGPNPGLTNFAPRDLPQLRRSGGSDSVTGRLARCHPRRILASDRNKRICHPIAAGTPFILCYYCFQLLKLPRKLRATKKSHHGLQCGACSATIELVLENKRSVVLVPPQIQPIAANNNKVHVEMLIPYGSVATSSMKNESYDFDANSYTIESVDCEPKVQLEEQRLSSGKAGKRQYLSSSSSCSSEESNQDTSVVPNDRANPAEMPIKTILVRPPPSAPLKEHLDYSTAFTLSRSEVGNNIACNDQENEFVEKGTFYSNSVATAAMPTEMEVASDALPKTNSSQDLEIVFQEEEQVGKSKDSESTFATSESGFTDLAGSTQHGSERETDVYINGQLIRHCEVREAEKLAGPISPGDYWYDSQAGFWGVMGNSCLGIIPPFIQEFSFPMPVNCAGGTTAVYLNGRELHTRDLDILASRGLPTTRHKCYVVEMSGKVIDEDTGKLVVNLGKLAPTVERARCGFGMKTPEDLDN
ncbi:hypothetical protein Ancab_015410 [Ancistrocladus abbreviatus]